MKQKAIGPGHNRPPRSLDEMVNDQDRVRINKEVMALLKPIPDPNGEKYLERVINDTDVIGFKAKANPGGSRSYFYQYTPKGRDEEKTKDKIKAHNLKSPWDFKGHNDITKKTTKNKNPKLLFDENLTGTFFIK